MSEKNDISDKLEDEVKSVKEKATEASDKIEDTIKATDSKKTTAVKKSLFERFSKWCKEIIAEFHRVTWPSRKELAKMTLTVIVTSMIFAVAIASLDAVFKLVVGYLVTL